MFLCAIKQEVYPLLLHDTNCNRGGGGHERLDETIEGGQG